MALQTALMKAGLAKRKPTPRIVKLVSLLKMIKAKGEKFNSCHPASPIIPQTLQQLDVYGPYVVVQKPDLYQYKKEAWKSLHKIINSCNRRVCNLRVTDIPNRDAKNTCLNVERISRPST